MEKRNTIQKQLVLDAVHKLANHPTADAVYDMVSAAHPNISKATVYRNLTGMSEEGKLRHIHMPNGADRFDHCLTPHNHIECTICGGVADAPQITPELLDEQAAKETGFTEVTHDVVFYGVCPNCQSNA
ncbi:MAG: transcriptional repressor [Clostridia bacterium]|nr:transcriptional repressor [Clostridia bacterium]NLS84957.1 transcriptional repressor [Oscillospiraceae bacterium]